MTTGRYHRMQKGSQRSKYIRIGDLTPKSETKEVWGLTYKCASTSMLEALPQPRLYTKLRTGDHVRIIVRDPRDRMVSSWKWFTTAHTSYLPAIMEENETDHRFLMDRQASFEDWVATALKYWNPHWVPQTEIHPRWREFELIPIHDLHKLEWGHRKKTRVDNAWEEHFTPELLGLINEVYNEDLEMWKEIKDGTNTRTNRVL